MSSQLFRATKMKPIKKSRHEEIGGVPGETSIIRWAGSKKKMLSQIKLASPPKFNTYIEPFMGSGAVFLSMAPKSAMLSDANHDLINLYKIIKKRPLDVWHALNSLPTSQDFYYKLRSVKNEDLDKFSNAVRFIYLNRYCFNGLYRTNRLGEFNVSRGKGHLGIPSWEIIEEFSSRLKNARLDCTDFEKMIEKAESDDFVYLDPPYIDLSKRDRGEYGYGAFEHADLERLSTSANKARKRHAKVLISYSDCRYIRRLFSHWHIYETSVRRNISSATGERKVVKELLIASYP